MRERAHVIENSIKAKIGGLGKTLDEIGIKHSLGVKLDSNAFKLTKEEKELILLNHPELERWIIPYYDYSSVEPYKIDYSEKYYIILIEKGWTYRQGMDEDKFIEKYNYLYKFLDQRITSSRKGYFWELRQPNYKSYRKAKIVATKSRDADKVVSAIDYTDWIAAHSLLTIYSTNTRICTLLNSRLLWKMAEMYRNEFAGTGVKVLQHFPFIIGAESYNKLKLLEKIDEIYIHNIEESDSKKEIEHIVQELYELTDDEVDYIINR